MSLFRHCSAVSAFYRVPSDPACLWHTYNPSGQRRCDAAVKHTSVSGVFCLDRPSKRGTQEEVSCGLKEVETRSTSSVGKGGLDSRILVFRRARSLQTALVTSLATEPEPMFTPFERCRALVLDSSYRPINVRNSSPTDSPFGTCVCVIHCQVL